MHIKHSNSLALCTWTSEAPAGVLCLILIIILKEIRGSSKKGAAKLTKGLEIWPARKVKRNRLTLEKRVQKGVVFSLLTWAVEKAAVGYSPYPRTAEEEGDQPDLGTGEGWTRSNREGVRWWDTLSGETGVHKIPLARSWEGNRQTPQVGGLAVLKPASEKGKIRGWEKAGMDY